MSNKKLQQVQNGAARITLRMSRTEHTTLLLRMLHWLPVSSRMAYKIDSMPCFIDYCISKISLGTLNCVYTCKTTVFIIRPKHPQCSYNKDKSYSQRTLAYQGPSNWNRVPGEIRRIEDTFAFRRKLKISLFHQQD